MKASFSDMGVVRKQKYTSYKNKAAQQLHKAIMSLQLTSLSLIDNDFMEDECHDIIPDHNAGNLTKLRCVLQRQENSMAACLRNRLTGPGLVSLRSSNDKMNGR